MKFWSRSFGFQYLGSFIILLRSASLITPAGDACPLTDEPFEVDISEDGSVFTVSSPIDNPIIKRHYLLFAFKAKNHGSIKGGRKSWD